MRSKRPNMPQVEGLSYDTKRKLDILRTGIVLPAPTTPGAATELNNIATKLQSDYGKGKGTLNGKPINGSDIEAEMGNLKHTPAQFAEMWTSWHDNVGAPMKNDYARMVGIANAGSKELGFADTGAMWRSGYDMPPEAFAADTERLWQEVKPLYMALHTYTRSQLNKKYGSKVQPATGPIRADLLGNMWAQEWGNIYPLVAPKGAGDLGYDIGDLLEKKGKKPLDMVKYGEGFYSSLGMAPLPQTFWQRSMFVKPEGREVVCHASAWDLDNEDDVRIKMCTKVNSDDFVTIHHELGHNYYQRAYKAQPYLYLNGANDGFHEAIGDFVALSITPQYLVDIGLLNKSAVPSADKDIGLLLRQAMDKVAFLPFGLLVDRYRWGIFDGSIAPADYNNCLDQAAHRLSGHRPADRAVGRRLRRRRQVPHPRQHALHPLLPGADPAVPVLQGGVRPGRLEGPAPPLQLLRQQGSRPAAERDARNGRLQAVARRAREVHRQPGNLGPGDGRIFRPAEGMARQAERRQAPGLVNMKKGSGPTWLAPLVS